MKLFIIYIYLTAIFVNLTAVLPRLLPFCRTFDNILCCGAANFDIIFRNKFPPLALTNYRHVPTNVLHQNSACADHQYTSYKVHIKKRLELTNVTCQIPLYTNSTTQHNHRPAAINSEQKSLNISTTFFVLL